MADTNVPITAGAGTAIDAQSVTQGATTVYQQTMTLGDGATAGRVAKVTAAGEVYTNVLDYATTGTLAALNSAVTVAINGDGVAGVQLTGTWVGTVSFRATEDPLGVAAPASSFFPVNGIQSVSGAQVATATGNGQWRINSGSYTAIQVLMTAYTSGTATVWVNVSNATTMTTLAEPLPAGTNAIGSLTATASRSSAYSAAVATVLTGLTTAAAAYSAAAAIIDNSAALDLYDDLELTFASMAAAPVANTLVEVYLIPSIDGTNFADSGPPAPNLYVGGFPVRAVTTAQRLIVRGVPLPPGAFQYVLRNGTAQALVGGAVRRRPYRLQLG